jgi:hypothetical protein
MEPFDNPGIPNRRKQSASPKGLKKDVREGKPIPAKSLNLGLYADRGGQFKI